jgi:transcriptional regulator with XRE-family HTH domain
MAGVAAELKRAREAQGWTQSEAAERLGLSQGYVSLLESGGRPVPTRLASSLLKTLGLSPSTLPPGELNLEPDRLPGALAALGYEPFGYLRGRLFNPTAVLLSALRQNDLPSRVVEALPWLALHSRTQNREWLVERAKLHDVQNRLAYVVTLACELLGAAAAAPLRELVLDLEPSRLAREDTLCHDSMTEAERRWLRERRSPQAAHWNLLTDLRREHLPYAA